MTPLTGQSRPMLARGTRLHTDPLSGRPVLLYPEGFLELDDTGHEILMLCRGDLSLDDILRRLAEQFEAPPEELRCDVIECLSRLRQDILVTW